MLRQLGRALLCLLPLTAAANDAVFVAADAIHRAGSGYVSIERGIYHVGALDPIDQDTLAVVGAEPFELGPLRIGVAYLSDTTEISGTRLNFSISAEWRIGKAASVMLRHYSHGAMLGIAKDKANAGWNILGIKWSF